MIDFGLVILIWMTQLIVYPSFTKFSKDELFTWHSTYTVRISVLVMPLMIGQLGIHVYELFQTVTVTGLVALGFIILAWVNTFLFAVPLHNRISSGDNISAAAIDLVSVNAWRTGFWTIVFLIDLAVKLF